jgi:hypothetical protein
MLLNLWEYSIPFEDYFLFKMYIPSIEQYKSFNKSYNDIIVGEDIEGDKFDTFEEWNAYPYKYEIMNEAMKFKEHLRKISYVRWFRDVKRLDRLGLPNMTFYKFNTPIIYPLKNNTIHKMNGLLREFEKCVNGNNDEFQCPSSLVNTKLGLKLLSELKEAKFTDNIFCHNALYYKSFVVKNNKLVGIRNWQYAGYFPPEFEDIIAKYLDNIF